LKDIVVTIHESWITIDGELPEGYRLVVHNHSGDPEFYSYIREVDGCRYPDPTTSDRQTPDDGGVRCFEYTEP
jgi:hypothetical protein